MSLNTFLCVQFHTHQNLQRNVNKQGKTLPKCFPVVPARGKIIGVGRGWTRWETIEPRKC